MLGPTSALTAEITLPSSGDGSPRELTALLARLRASERALAEAQRIAGVGSWTWDLQGDRLEFSPQLCRMYGLDPESFDGSFDTVMARVHPDDHQQVADLVEQARANPHVVEAEHRVVHPDGKVVWLRGRGQVERAPDGTPLRMHGTGLDITDSRRTAEQLRALAVRLAVLAAVVETTVDSVIVVDLDDRIVSWNGGAQRMYGYSAQEAVGQPVTLIKRPEQAVRLPQIRQEIVEHGHLRFESEDVRKDGMPIVVSVSASVVRDAAGAPTAFVGISRDVTEQRQARQRERAHAAQLAHLALHDPLTGLGNRALLTERLDRAFAARDRPFGLVLVDLDGFKAVNDSHGHAVGDELLVEVGRRLRRCGRPADTAVRLGGDEFAILVEGDPAPVAARVLEQLSAPVTIAERRFVPTGSVGAARGADAGAPDQLLLHADLAMYAAKAAGKATVAAFTPAMLAAAS